MGDDGMKAKIKSLKEILKIEDVLKYTEDKIIFKDGSEWYYKMGVICDKEVDIEVASTADNEYSCSIYSNDKKVYQNYILKNNWMEILKEGKCIIWDNQYRWRAEKGEDFYFVMYPDVYNYPEGNERSIQLYRAGNYFKTKKEAQESDLFQYFVKKSRERRELSERVELGNIYYIIGATGEIHFVESREDFKKITAKKFWLVGNYFTSKESAENSELYKLFNKEYKKWNE